LDPNTKSGNPSKSNTVLEQATELKTNTTRVEKWGSRRNPRQK